MDTKGFHIELPVNVHEFYRRRAFNTGRSIAEEMRRVLVRPVKQAERKKADEPQTNKEA